LVIVCVTPTVVVDAANEKSPLYCAVIVYVPIASDEVLNAACPPATAALPMNVPLAKNETLPVGVPGVPLTVAVKVTAVASGTDGFDVATETDDG
jgi:hypothetical protein